MTLQNPRLFGDAMAWNIDGLAGVIYRGPTKLGFARGHQGTEKKRRVAVLRALKAMVLPGTWQTGHAWPHDQTLLFDPCDERSMLHRDLLVEGGDEVRPARVERIKQEVLWACRLRDGSPAEREMISQERADAEQAMEADYGRQRAAIELNVSDEAAAEHGKRLSTSLSVSDTSDAEQGKQLRVSREEREIGRRDRRLAIIELGASNLVIGVDKGLLVDILVV
jgi:hypothetical protein